MRLRPAQVEPGAARRGPRLPTLRATWVSIIYGTSEAKFAVAIWGAEGRDKIMGGQNL
jgi:hypothetical protein